MMSTASVFQDSALSEYMKNSLEASHDSLIESLKLCLEEELGVTSVGRTFRMIQKIGQGSFGEVFKTVSLRTGMFVALKRIRIEPETRGVSGKCIFNLAFLLVPQDVFARNALAHEAAACKYR